MSELPVPDIVEVRADVVKEGDDRLRELLVAGDLRLREHIDQQIEQISQSHLQSDTQVQLALTAAEKLELERVDRVEARIQNGLAGVVQRLEEGDSRLTENLQNLKEAVQAAIDAQQHAVAIAQEASTKAIDKALTSVDLRFSEVSDQNRDRVAAIQREVETAQHVAAEAVTKAELAARLRMDEGDTRLREHIGAQYGQISAALESARRETNFAAEASEKAIAKAETANEKRFEAVNAFRAQLVDQAATFLPREVAEGQFTQLAERLRALETTQLRTAGANEQSQRASDKMQPWMIWAVGALLGIIIVVANFIAGA